MDLGIATMGEQAVMGTAEWLAALSAKFEGFKVDQLEYCHQKVEEGIGVAKSLAPVGTGEEDIPGELRDSIGIISEDSKEIVWGTTVPYAPEVEYGNTKMSAQPFMRPAMARMKRK
jgi:HK97 gp10 family phage protein